MSIYQRIRDLASARNMTVRDVEKRFGYSNGSLRVLKDTANSKRLVELADFFDVTVDYLLGRSTNTITYNHDLKSFLDSSLDSGLLLYDGKPSTPDQLKQLNLAINLIFKGSQ